MYSYDIASDRENASSQSVSVKTMDFFGSKWIKNARGRPLNSSFVEIGPFYPRIYRSQPKISIKSKFENWYDLQLMSLKAKPVSVKALHRSFECQSF